MINAINKNGSEGIFSEQVWKTGIPQKRGGWVETSETKTKTLPKALVDFQFKAQVKTDCVPGCTEHKQITPPIEQDDLAKKPETPPEVKKVTKPKVKRNDNPKQQKRTARRRNTGNVG